jgi:alpha-1,6-mannosyltransferase
VTIFWCALISALLYGAVYWAQHAIVRGADDAGTVAVYLLATMGLFACYAWVVRVARTHGARASNRRALVALPLIVWPALALAPPTLSIDVFTYLAHGHQVNNGDNPYASAVKEVAAERYGQELGSHGWLPVHGLSPYGPAWTRLESAVQGTFANVGSAALFFKIASAAAGIAGAWLIWAILSVVAPAHRLTGTVLYLWNPLVILEIAGDGHNEAFVLLFVLGGLLLFVKGREVAGVCGVFMAALIKITALSVAPPFALLALRQPLEARSRVLRIGAIVLGAGGIIAVARLLYGDLWLGPNTLAGVQQHGSPSVTPSTAGVLLHFLIQSHSIAASARLVSVLLAVGLLVAGAILTLRSRDLESALLAAGRLTVVFLVLATTYWPWYVVMPGALLALSPRAREVPITIGLVSLFGRLVAANDRLRINGAMDWPTETIITTVVGLWIPAVLLIGWHLRNTLGSAERTDGRSAMVFPRPPSVRTTDTSVRS